MDPFKKKNSSNSSKGVLGNTETKTPRKQESAAFRYCFTVHNYEDKYEEIYSSIVPISKKGVLGKEICPTTQKKHLQGYVSLNEKMRITQLIRVIPGAHFESCKGTEEDNIKYCRKEGNYIDWGFPKPIKIIEKLYPWQQDIENIYLTEPDDRTINWYWERTGNVGKSTFVKYMFVKHKIAFCNGGKATDLYNMIFNTDMDICRGVFWDIPRSSTCISYNAVEGIKNGLICNTKYETGAKAFNPPHIFIFANFPPDESVLSADRWNIVEIGNVKKKEDAPL